jgi:hypothetical protein
MPEIMASTDKQVVAHKLKAPPAGSREAAIDLILNDIPWAPKPRKFYAYGKNTDDTDQVRIPPFAKRMPHNDWSIVVIRLIERLGVPVWGWRIAKLAYTLQTHIATKLKRADHKTFSLRSKSSQGNMKASERAGLADFRLAAKSLNDEQAAVCIAKFVCRLATAMIQNHPQAISALQDMKAPLPLLRDMESWILSESYGELRKLMGTSSRVPIPKQI